MSHKADAGTDAVTETGAWPSHFGAALLASNVRSYPLLDDF